MKNWRVCCVLCVVRNISFLCLFSGTTRPPRSGELNGVDYRFVSVEEFAELDRAGELLESGIFEGLNLKYLLQEALSKFEPFGGGRVSEVSSVFSEGLIHQELLNCLICEVQSHHWFRSRNGG